MLPEIFTGRKICIICEGSEEYEYLSRLIALDVWNKKYRFSLVNADGNGNIPARYQDKFQNNSYDVVFIICDTDRKPYEQYSDIKHKINEFHGSNNASDEVVIFCNPCTMLVILLHFAEEIKLTSQNKKKNSPIIEKYTGIKNYTAKKEQREKLFSLITSENYVQMAERIDNLPILDNVSNSSNFKKYITYFENEDDDWIDVVNIALL